MSPTRARNGTSFAPADAGVMLTVRVTARARASALAGMVTGSDGRQAVGVKVAAAPVEGAANAELIAFLSEVLKMAKSDIIIRSGATSRVKRLLLRGDPDEIVTKLEAWIAGGPAL